MEVGRVRAIWAGWAGGWVDWTALNPRQPHKKKKKKPPPENKRKEMSHMMRDRRRGGVDCMASSVAWQVVRQARWHGMVVSVVRSAWL